MNDDTRLGGLVVLGESLLIFVPLVVLGAAIGWPGSLDDPAAVALPRLLDNETPVRVGYLAYLAYSVLFLPVAVIVTAWLTGARDRAKPLPLAIVIAVGMAVASTALRAVGIIRWLSTMFPLAERWRAASSDAARETIAAQFAAMNDFGGSIGEQLGVSLFASIWLGFTVVAMWRSAPRWLSVTSALVALLVALPLVELAGIDAASGLLVTVGSTAINLWFLALGVMMLSTSRRRAAAEVSSTRAAMQAAT